MQHSHIIINSISFKSQAAIVSVRSTFSLFQGQLLEGVECHIYLYCFTFDDINLNRAFVIIVLFPKNIAIRKCVQMIYDSGMH